MNPFVVGTRKGKVSADYTTKDMYKYYKGKYSNPVEYKLYRLFLEEFYSEILNLVIYNGLDYSMPARLGSLRVKKKKNVQRIDPVTGELIHNLQADWVKTLALWEQKYPGLSKEELKAIESKPIVYHLNEHTDNFYFKWYWDKISSNVKNQSAYQFEPIRSKKREAAQAWKNIPKLRNIYYE
jgi:hypothetical protein